MIRSARFLIAVFSIFILDVGLSRADGLSTAFVDVLVLDVPLGTPRLVQDKQNHGIVLTNLGEQPIDVTVQVLIPQSEQLRGGASPVPTTDWIHIEPAHIILMAHETGSCDVRLDIPKESRYGHHLYQAMIWSRARPVGAKGVTLSAGLLSRLRFKTANK